MKKLTEAEWIARFEQVQGRKPSPEELYKAHQDGLIAPKNRIQLRHYIGLGLLIVAALLAVLYLTTANRQGRQEKTSRSSASSSQSTAIASTSSTEASSSDSSTTSSSSSISSTQEEKDANHGKEVYSDGVWTAQKAEQLASLMDSWSRSMNQVGYKNITDEASSLPLYWTANTSQKLDTTYSSIGTSSSEYTIVAVYQYVYGGNSVHRYFFTIKQDGSPVVLYSATTNGSRYYVKETENADLKSGYATIVNPS